MQSPQQPFSSPPIPAPDEQYVPSTLLTGPRDWKSAPQIVKSVALLAFVGMVFTPLLILMGIFGLTSSPRVQASLPYNITLLTFYFLLFAASAWLRFALKKAVPAAWTVQLVLSCLGVLGFPIGTLIHGYILSQWFKPETKAWFGLQ